MGKVATTRMSSKGQVVIPEEVRQRLKLVPGSRFIVLGEGDVIILKTLSAPSMDQFDDLIELARKQARRAGLKQKDVIKAIEKIRSNP